MMRSFALLTLFLLTLTTLVGSTPVELPDVEPEPEPKPPKDEHSQSPLRPNQLRQMVVRTPHLESSLSFLTHVYRLTDSIS